MARRRTNPDFLNGVPELLILRLLKETPLHGYEIVRRIRLLSGTQLEFGEGCIYPVLHRLEGEGIIRSRRESVNERQRVVYRLTRQGRGRLEQSTADWNRVVAAVRMILEGEDHGGSAKLA